MQVRPHLIEKLLPRNDITQRCVVRPIHREADDPPTVGVEVLMAERMRRGQFGLENRMGPPNRGKGYTQCSKLPGDEGVDHIEKADREIATDF
jgi:hypothetical protein